MTNKELQEELKKHPDDLEVVKPPLIEHEEEEYFTIDRVYLESLVLPYSDSDPIDYIVVE